MRVTFSEKPYFINSDVLHDIDFASRIQFGRYELIILHTYVGSGMSDKYQKVSYLEIFLGDENVTRSILRNVFTSFPIEGTTENLKIIMDILHAKL